MATLTNVQVATNASVALITPLTANNSLKVVSLPVWSPGKFVYVADSNGNAGTYPFGIGTNGPSTIIVGATPRSLNYVGSGTTSSFSAVVNRNYGAMGFVAGGTAATTSATQIYYTVINEGGNQSATYLSTNVLDAGTINTQNLNFVGSGAVGFTNLNVANFTASNTIQAIGGISTTTISTASAYIGTLTIGNASDLGIFNVGGLFTAGGGLAVSGAAFTTTGFTTTHANAVSITTGGLQVGGLTTLSNTATLQGGLSTTTISTSSAYINTLTVNSESIASTLAVGGLITASAGANVTGGATIDATSTNIISSGSIYAGSFFYSVASY